MMLVFSSTIEGIAYNPPLCLPINNVGLKKDEIQLLNQKFPEETEETI